MLIPPLVMASAFIAGPAFATSDGPDRFAVRDVRPIDTLALRAQPNASARKITGLPPQTRGLQNLGCVDGKTGQAPADPGPAGNQSWCKVRIGSLVGWAFARFLREDAEPLKPYSVSSAPSGPQFVATSTAIEKATAGAGRWKVVTQTVISKSTTAAQPNEVTVRSELVDCRRGQSEVIRLGGDDPGYATKIEDEQSPTYDPALGMFEEYNLWAFACRGAYQRYRWR
ncbi:SH3 domain-containing protein [Methylobacterium sp. E-066]|uniref:SH3 domain-containing protein n=1 Tax=Methylobacterium sp. E-066 TaxID=2836584 RepID=UPI001FBA3A16|nr:SH3 domain-containing protein [Methylobacterium sp. E-066]MCJ2144345.1 SH3 domain-containing protein [Methylobacterium sp. E-066]